MSLAACCPSSLRPLSIALFRSMAALSSALRLQPMSDADLNEDRNPEDDEQDRKKRRSTTTTRKASEKDEKEEEEVEIGDEILGESLLAYIHERSRIRWRR